jgi:hypothetical protein
MQQRPLSLSIIGWFLIAGSLLGVFGMFVAMKNPIAVRIYAQSPLPISVHIAVGIVGTLITLLSGYGILKGLNWSRFLYIGQSALVFAFTFFTMPVTSVLLLSLLFFAAIVFFLFRPIANGWFGCGAAGRA